VGVGVGVGVGAGVLTLMLTPPPVPGDAMSLAPQALSTPIEAVANNVRQTFLFNISLSPA
ncbi:MAG: hypothetical protein K2P68_06735, partial [Sphingomonas sp.]|nr:hypothetical protein [Sphingomonas sp.]